MISKSQCSQIFSWNLPDITRMICTAFLWRVKKKNQTNIISPRTWLISNTKCFLPTFKSTVHSSSFLHLCNMKYISFYKQSSEKVCWQRVVTLQRVLDTGSVIPPLGCLIASPEVFIPPHTQCVDLLQVNHSHSKTHQILKHTTVQVGNVQYHFMPYSKMFEKTFVSNSKDVSKSERGRNRKGHCLCKSCALLIAYFCPAWKELVNALLAV